MLHLKIINIQLILKAFLSFYIESFVINKVAGGILVFLLIQILLKKKLLVCVASYHLQTLPFGITLEAPQC